MKRKQISKKKFKEKQERLRKMKREEKNGSYSLPGQPNPLAVDFAQLRRRALETPQLKPFTQDDVDVVRHCKPTDYNRSKILAVVVQVVFRDKRFFWLIESMFVSKLDGSYILLDLLSSKQKDELKLAKTEALGNCGLPNKAMEIRTANKYLWEIPFSESDYELLDPSIRALADLGDETKDE
jgi:hypothetical protein